MELNQLLQVDGLGFSYPAKKVFRDLLLLSKGEILCLMGPNGCGKTTLLDTIMSIISRMRVQSLYWENPLKVSEGEIAQNIAYNSNYHIVFPIRWNRLF